MAFDGLTVETGQTATDGHRPTQVENALKSVLIRVHPWLILPAYLSFAFNRCLSCRFIVSL